jgi:serine/threonine protein kinase
VPEGRPASEQQRPRDELAPGTRIARYTLIDVIGAGGIGIVYTAHDPDLDRRVALKLLRPSKLAGRRSAIQQRRARLLREAQALARLSHPNVVPVYEVGTFGAQIYLVMELIEGLTLGAWFRARVRKSAEVIEVFVQAGRGLAAAHQAEIVHRDFKPDNVLVGRDGRVRVLDFGLAGPLNQHDSIERTTLDPDASESAGSEVRAKRDGAEASETVEHSLLEPMPAVTRHGQILGTPAYMAPEQARGNVADARSDQFSFCVALYEALYGQRPFRGRNDDLRRFVELARGKLPGRRPSDLGNELERILLRGLSLAPERRYPSMQALLDELEQVVHPRVAGWWLPTGILGLALATVLAFVGLGERERGPSCDDAGGAIEPVWNATLAGELRSAAARSRRPYASATVENASTSLDEWSARWRKAKLRTCESGGEAQLVERRHACLDRMLVRVESTLGSLGKLAREGSSDQLLDRLDIIDELLPSLDACEAAPLLERPHLVPAPDLAATVAELEVELAKVEGRYDGDADYEAAFRSGEALLARARTTGFDPLTAEVQLLVGQIEHARTKQDASTAERRLSEAVWTAQRAGHDEVLVRAAAQLVTMLALQGRLEPARLWADLARATLPRLGPGGVAEAELQLALAELATAEGDFELALQERGRAIAQLEQLDRTHHRSYLRAGMAQANDLREVGRYDEAAALLERTRAQTIAFHGPDHPRVADVLETFANLRSSQGHQAEALELSRAALAMVERVYGEDSLEVAKVLNNLAIVLDESGRNSEAVGVLERARTIFVRSGEGHEKALAYVEVNLGQALHNLGRHDEAEQHYRVALATFVALYGEEHPNVVVARLNLAATRTHGPEVLLALDELEQGRQKLELLLGATHPDLAELELERARTLRGLARLDEALLADQRALTLLEGTFGSSNSRLVPALTSLAQTEQALGHDEVALTTIERAVALIDENENSPVEVAWAKLVLGELLRTSEASDAAARSSTAIAAARTIAERTEGSAALLARLDALP